MFDGYSQDLRERFVKAVDTGMSARAAGRLFSISAATATRWASRWRMTGSVAAKPKTGHRVSPLEAHADWLLAQVKETVDLTLEEIRARLRQRGVSAAVSAIWRFYRRHRITFKKKRYTPASASARTSPDAGKSGSKHNRDLIRQGSSSSTKHQQIQ